MDEAGLQAEIGITLNKLTKQLAAAEVRMNRTAQKLENQFKRPQRAIERGFQQVDKSARGFAGGGLRAVSLQLSQVAQQGSATGDYVKALAIQLPDLALGFGTVGIAAGALAGVLLPTAIDLAGFGDKSKEAEEKAKKFAKALADLETAMRSANEAVTLASVNGLDELEKKYEVVTANVRNLAKALAEIELFGVQNKISEILDGVISEDFGKKISSNIDGLSAALVETTTEDIELIKREIALLEQDIANAAIPDQSQVSLLAEMREELALITNDIENAGSLSENFAIDPQDVERMRELQRLIPEAVSAQNFIGAADMISELRGLMEEFGAETRDGLGRELTTVEDILRRNVALLNDAEQAGVGVKDAASGISSELSKSADEAGRLRDNLYAAMSAEFNARPDAPGGGRGGDPRGFEDDPYYRGRFFPNPERKNRSSRKTGRGSGSKFDPLESGNRQIDQLELQISTLNKTSSAVAALVAKYELLEAAKRRGVDLDKVNLETGKTLRQEIEAQAEKIGELTTQYENARDGAQHFSTVASGLSSGLSDLIFEGEALSDVLGNLAKSLAAAALEAATLAAFNSLFSAILPGYNPSSGAVTANAQGNVFNKGRITAFASGGVVNSPTYFPMRGGTGLMGEAGPEAIMPLMRMPGGDLGVRAKAGDVTVPVSVKIQNNSSAQVDVRQSQDGRNLEILIDQKIASAMAGPRGQKVMRDTYGVRPSVRGA